MSSELFVRALALYAGMGFGFAIAFVALGVTPVDGNAAGTRLGFRLIILPGVTALWPVLLHRWIRARS